MVTVNQRSKIGIILINWNQAEDTIECLKSLTNVNYLNFETVIIDNASKADSIRKIHDTFPNIQLIQLNQNAGFVGGNNEGIKYFLAKDVDYILLLNNDTLLDKDFLTNLIDAAEEEAAVGILGPKIYYFGSNDKIWFGGGYLSRFSGKPYHCTTEDDGKVTKNDFITGCCLLVKTEVIKKIGSLDPDYFFIGEDVDLCLRARSAGFKIKYVPKSIIWHKVSASVGGVFTPINVYFQTRNSLLLAKKNNLNNLPFKISFYFSILRRLMYFFIVMKMVCAIYTVKGIYDYHRGNYGKGLKNL